MAREVNSAWLLSIPYSFLTGSLVASTVTVTLLAHPNSARELMVFWEGVAIALALWAAHLFWLTYQTNAKLAHPVFPGYNFVVAMLASFAVIAASIWTLVYVVQH